jgi:hypothetical protein
LLFFYIRFMPNIDDIHAAARNWSDETAQHLRSSITANGLVDSGALRDSLVGRSAIESRRAETVSAGVRLLRHGVFLAKGARKGQGGKKGSTWRTKSGELRRTNPASLGKATGGVNWFNPVIRREVLKLEQAVAEVYILDIKKALIK